MQFNKKDTLQLVDITIRLISSTFPDWAAETQSNNPTLKICGERWNYPILMLCIFFVVYSFNFHYLNPFPVDYYFITKNQLAKSRQ